MGAFVLRPCRSKGLVSGARPSGLMLEVQVPVGGCKHRGMSAQTKRRRLDLDGLRLHHAHRLAVLNFPFGLPQCLSHSLHSTMSSCMQVLAMDGGGMKVHWP